jgi:hypothetical protein
MSELTQQILDAARGDRKNPLRVAVLVLDLPDGTRREVLYEAEYGDNAALDNLSRFAEELQPLLRDGERLSLYSNVFKLSDFLSTGIQEDFAFAKEAQA